MDVRQALLQAAIKVFAETGWRGATTRRIAQEADVNEVTLFRHFRSKDDLLRTSLEFFAAQAVRHTLPEDPVDPRTELLAWCRAHHRELYRLRTLIRRAMGEFCEHPQNCAHGMQASVQIANELAGYLGRLKRRGLAAPGFDERTATNMLMGAIFTDALGRDTMPERFPHSMREAVERYVDLLLEAIGAHAVPDSASRPSPGPHHDDTTDAPLHDRADPARRSEPGQRTDVAAHAAAGARPRARAQHRNSSRPRRRATR
jgi:AcrR family transcriptional regulator